MASILKVDQLQLSDGSTPTAGDLGLDTSNSVINVEMYDGTGGFYTTALGKVNLNVGATYTKKKANSKVLVHLSATPYHYDVDSNAWDNVALLFYVDGSQAMVGPSISTQESGSQWRSTGASMSYMIDNSNPSCLVEIGVWNLSSSGAEVGITSAHYNGKSWQLTFTEIAQ